MGRYYCKKCKSEQIVPNELIKWLVDKEIAKYGKDVQWTGQRLLCDFCNDEDYILFGGEEIWMNLIPDYETPEQYEKRTGKKWNGAVWRKHKGASQESTGWIAQRFTGNLEYFYLLCAQSPEPPPDDWRPEEE